MTRRSPSFLLAAIAGAIAFAPGDKKYLDDFESLADTVKREHANVKGKKVDWDAVVKEFRPRFEKCASDVEHVRNVMEMLARLGDSHTNVTDHGVDGKALPAKFDGLYGGGLWFGFDDGKFVLRGTMPGHSLAGTIPLGSVLVSVDGEPAWIAMGRVRRHVGSFLGISSDHSFWGSLGNKALPFGPRGKVADDARPKQVEVEFLLPDRKTKKASVGRWGPNGKAFDFVGLFFPPGVTRAEGAVASLLATKWSKKVGFLKVTGSQDAATAKAFHAAFDTLKGMDALLLDCRSMGGGGDDFAWEMCGRLFTKPASNGRNGTIAPSGSWQFDGPVVMLQDETEVSSAETFTWAASETKRVVSVGRPTGGWGIIPRGFALPSRLAKYRLGCNDRPTPITGVHTEGIGWPPDVLVPFGPEVSAWPTESPWSDAKGDAVPDPSMALGLAALGAMHAGASSEETRAAFASLAKGEIAAFSAFAKKHAAKAKELDGANLAKLFADDLKQELEMESAALALDDEMLPDLVGATKRLPKLLARAKAAGLAADGAKLEKAVKAAKAELAAQEALLALPDPSFAADEAARKAWLGKHGATKTGKWVKSRLWKGEP